MNLLNNWIFCVGLYIILVPVFTHSYKASTKNLNKPGALTVILQIMGAITALMICPFFEIKFPEDVKVYIFLGISIIFYAISDRVNTTVRSGIEASTFSILKQLSTTIMIFAGLIFLKEPFVFKKFIGAMLIIFSNIFIFYKKGNFKINKYMLLGILANTSYAIALFLDVNISDNFNLPIYVAITLGVPAIMIALIERVSFSDVKKELTNGNKKSMIITGITWGSSIIVSLRAYQLQEVTIVAPLCALTVIANVIAGYIFFGERDNLIKKIIAAILIIISVILIKV